MKKLLLATNLELNSQQALERSLLVARMHNAELNIVHVETSQISNSLNKLEQKVSEAIQHLESELSEEFGAGFEPASIKSISGDPVLEIVAQASACEAELVIAGLSEKSHANNLLDGTILEKLLLLMAKPLIVVKSRPTGNYRNVLAGLDLLPTSRNAITFALKVAPTADFVITHARELETEDSNLRGQLMQIARECFAAARKDVGVHYGAIEIVIEEGSVADVITNCVKKSDPDLVAFGKHNKGSQVGPYIGSGARSVLEQLDADMLIMPPI